MSNKLPYPLKNINDFVDMALAEDLGDGDHTSLACIPKNAKGRARLLVKQSGVIAGVELAIHIFKRVDRKLKVNVKIRDGHFVKPGDIILTVEGSDRSILGAERLVLNCMQRMSGIATLTNEMTKLCKGTKTKLLDTRKTTPNFRMMEKWGVLIGGGVNHRFGLYDMILIKDNHVDYCGGITQAIKNTHHYLKRTGKKLKIEIETRNLNEVQEVLNIGGVHRILLDNFSPSELKKAVKLINKKHITEASGGITAKNIAAYAKTGVDFISSGALTHSAKSIDLSLKAY